MDKELFEYVAERVETLAVSPASKQETSEAAKDWKAAVEANPDAAEAETERLLDYLEGRMLGIDDVIEFMEGPGREIFGEEALAAQRARKEAGEKYCNCEMHTAAGELLAKFGRIEL